MIKVIPCVLNLSKKASPLMTEAWEWYVDTNITGGSDYYLVKCTYNTKSMRSQIFRFCKGFAKKAVNYCAEFYAAGSC